LNQLNHYLTNDTERVENQNVEIFLI
jgi:hypothetical protein